MGNERYDGEDITPGFWIGIDFGTTFSGVTYATTYTPDEITIVKGWPTSHERFHTKDESKVPSRLHYGPSGIKWGYDTPTGMIVKWFKLLLLEEEDFVKYLKRVPEEISKAQEALLAAGKSAEDAVSDYLRLLWQHTLKEMREDCSASAVQVPFTVFITVPAIWPQYAVSKMRTAAERAGILDKRPGITDTILHFVSEPEAAALAVLRTLKKRHVARAGDIYVVADIGGGTTDIISYKVTSEKPFAVEECVIGAGGLCGSIFVDHAFENLLRWKLGSIRWQRISASSKARLMEDTWEHSIKRIFNDSTTNKDWNITVPPEAILDYDPEFGRDSLTTSIKISCAELKEAFNQSLNPTIALINAQIDEIEKNDGDPKAIILVGGFGKCQYVGHVLRAEYQQKSEGGIEILSPRGESSDAWSAICRGACLKAQEEGSAALVQTRLARYSYGMEKGVPYDRKTDKAIEHRKFFHKVQEEDWIYKMEWFIKRGTALSTINPAEFSYNQSYSYPNKFIEGGGTMYDTFLYSSDSAIPPTIVDDPSVQYICKIQSSQKFYLRDLELSKSKTGRPIYLLNFNIGIEVNGAQVKFYLSREGKKFANKTVDIQYTTN